MKTRKHSQSSNFIYLFIYLFCGESNNAKYFIYFISPYTHLLYFFFFFSLTHVISIELALIGKYFWRTQPTFVPELALYLLFEQMHSQIPDKREVTVYQRKMLSNMRDAACCLPDLLENHSSLVSHKALSRNPRTSIQIIRKSHFHLLLNVIIVNESQFYLSTAYILLGNNGL